MIHQYIFLLFIIEHITIHALHNNRCKSCAFLDNELYDASISCSLLDRLRKTCSNFKKTLINQFVQDNLNKAYTSERRNQIC